MKQGRVKKVLTDKKYGFIDGENGDVFFHAKVVEGVAFRDIAVGQQVEYEDEPGAKGRQATSVHVTGNLLSRPSDQLVVDVNHGQGKPWQRVAFPINTVVTGEDGSRFRLIEDLRQGGNGVVFSAYRIDESGHIDRLCAVKVLKRTETNRIDRFHNEVRVLKSITHELIAPCYGSGQLTAGMPLVTLPWMAMDLGGDNLRSVVEKSGPIPQTKYKHIVSQMCQSISHLHKCGYIHRDIKPDNFVWSDDAEDNVMMIDLGLAKRMGEDVSGRPLDDFTKHLEFVGPVFFSSPELIRYAKDKTYPVDHRSDLFQFGKVLWYLATGDISAGIPSKRRDPLNGPIHAIVANLLADEPEDRFQTADNVLSELSKLP